jgi:tetratricopeptide (TPR) repeat protein
VISALLLVLLADGPGFETRYRAGLDALGAGRVAEARTHLEAARALEPANARLWVALAQAYARSGDLKAAEEAARRSETLARGDTVVLQALAFYRNQTGKALADIVQLRDAVRLNRYEEAYHIDLAQALLQAARFGDAIQSVEESRRVFARSPRLELAIGAAYYGLRRYEDAAGAFLRVTALAPDLEQPYLFLARMIDQVGPRLGAVAAACEAFVRAHPESYAAHYAHAKSLIADGLDGETPLRNSIARNGEYAPARFELGVVLERKRRWEDAAREFEKSAALDRNDPAPHYRLARIYERLGRKESARAERALHEKLSAEEASAMDRRMAGIAIK